MNKNEEDSKKYVGKLYMLEAEKRKLEAEVGNVREEVEIVRGEARVEKEEMSRVVGKIGRELEKREAYAKKL